MLNWSDVLACPDFWIAYFNNRVHCESGENWESVLADLLAYHDGPDIAWEVYGFDRDPQEAADNGGHTWTFDLPGGHTWSIEFLPVPGSYHFLNHPDLPAPVLTASDDPHFRLPFFRWPELESLHHWFAQNKRDEINPIWKTLALFRLYFFSEGDSAARIERLLLPDLAAAPLFSQERAASFLRRMLYPQITLTPEGDLAPLRWWREDRAGWVTNGINSTRCYSYPGDMDPGAREAVRNFLRRLDA
jgi:hypothetical protein